MKSTNQEQLTEHVNKLQSLLADPHPGLSTWCNFCGEHMKFISDFWSIEPGEEHLVKIKQAGPDLLAALNFIAGIGGNLPDERLQTKTGPNDAAHRGIMYCSARSVALEAIKKATA